MRKKLSIVAILAALCSGLVFFWGKQQYRRYDVPGRYAALTVSDDKLQGWHVYRETELGIRIKYPGHYFQCPRNNENSHYPFIPRTSFRQNTDSVEECRTAGLRIGLDLVRLGKISRISLGRSLIDLSHSSTVADIARQFLQGDNRPAVTLTRHFRKINGTDTIICTIRAPGESPFWHGHIFEVYILGVNSTGNGERILAILSNTGGGTPRVGDRALRRDVLQMYHTLSWRG